MRMKEFVFTDLYEIFFRFGWT